MINALTKTIGRKLTTGFLILLALLSLIAIVSTVGILVIRDTVQNDLDLAFRLDAASKDASIDLLESRRNEKDYQLRYRDAGLVEARKQYIDGETGTLAHIQNLRENLQVISDLEKQQGHDGAEPQNLLAAIDTYQNTFLGVVSLYEQRGVTDEGVIGAFRVSIHNLEDRLSNKGFLNLEVLLLQIRRNEKDYQLRGETQYIDNVKTLSGQLKSAISSSEIDAGEKREMQGLVDEYLTGFESLVTIDSQIAQQIETYRAVVRDVETPLVAINTTAQEGVAQAKSAIFASINSILFMVGITVVASVLLGLALSVLITNSIVRPLNAVTQTAQQVTIFPAQWDPKLGIHVT